MALIGFITCSSAEEAQKIADSLLQKKLIACANIVKEINSSYWWKGKIEHAEEALLILKTHEGLEAKIIAEAKKVHSYELPSIEFIKAESYKGIEEWIKDSTH